MFAKKIYMSEKHVLFLLNLYKNNEEWVWHDWLYIWNSLRDRSWKGNLEEKKKKSLSLYIYKDIQCVYFVYESVRQSVSVSLDMHVLGFFWLSIYINEDKKRWRKGFCLILLILFVRSSFMPILSVLLFQNKKNELIIL